MNAEQTVLLFVVSFFAFVLFIVLELTAENPLLELRVFKYRLSPWRTSWSSWRIWHMFSGIFFLPLFLQTFRGLGAMENGTLTTARALISGIIMPIQGRLFEKNGPPAPRHCGDPRC